MDRRKIKEELVKRYFERIRRDVMEAYSIAQKARSLGLDPEDHVEIAIAEGLPERVEGLVGSVAPQIIGKGIPKRIRELEDEYGPGDWRVALKIAEEVATGKFCSFSDRREAMEVGIRVGIAYVTLGIVAAPLEGFVELRIKKRQDGKDYMAMYFAGPIRAAGGTAGAVSVLIGDYIRRIFGLDRYDPTEDEVMRYLIEVDDYHTKIARLQYYPTRRELEFLVRNLPIEVTGYPTTDLEVSGKKDLPRVETNRIRGGMCLVLCECLAQKAKKLYKKLKKWGKDFGLEDWVDFLEKFLKIQEEEHAAASAGEEEEKIKPSKKYLEEAAAGRPIFAAPMARGGFRLRYGRCRTSGFAAAAVHPATMVVLNEFIAVGTQIRPERPGKSAGIGPCDTIEGPIVRLKNGSVVKVETYEQALKIKKHIDKVLFIGDLLVAYGDFKHNKHILAPSGWVEEWWIQEVEKALKEKNIPEDIRNTIAKFEKDPLRKKPTGEEAILIAKYTDTPLHPYYTYFWENLTKEEAARLIEYIKKNHSEEEGRIIIPMDSEIKRILEKLCFPHYVDEDKILFDKEHSVVIEHTIINGKEITPEILSKCKDGLDVINAVSPIKIMRKAGIYIGARMGRPEKFKMREMKGKPNVLFPVGMQGGRLRSINAAMEVGYVEAELPLFYCPKCRKFVLYRRCEFCGTPTRMYRRCVVCGKIGPFEEHCGRPALPYMKRKIDIREYVRMAAKNLGITIPNLIKGVRGLSNKERIPERLEKGLLRAAYGLRVNKDGTIRFDATELPLTAFRPKEIGISVEKAKELGYEVDIYGNPLERDDQLVELFPQDLIVNRKVAEDMVKVCKFIDELLQKLYGLPPYYNVKSIDDLVGKYVIVQAPHTSGGIVGRIIGFTDARACFAHPYIHAAIRRNCDGDELSLILLMDAFLNFSRRYLPDKRGARSMDAPLVLTLIVDPKEVDDEVYDMDIVERYPLEFYYATQNYAAPEEVEIETVEDRLGKPEQYFDFFATHDVSDINKAVLVTAYKELPTMLEKVAMVMDLAKKLESVDPSLVVEVTVERHFLKDIRGNFRKFFLQEFRCINCNEKYRRPPLKMSCISCSSGKGRLVYTVSIGSIKKYLPIAVELVSRYCKDNKYLSSVTFLRKALIEEIFPEEKDKKQTKLGAFLNVEGSSEGS